MDGNSHPAEVFTTRLDEQRDITLADNSVVHLDVGSEITVTMNDKAREITLTSGRALFDVAKDRERPFFVTAGGTRTTALGTKFQIQHSSDRVVVVLTEGSVSVTGAGVELGRAPRSRRAAQPRGHVRRRSSVRSTLTWPRAGRGPPRVPRHTARRCTRGGNRYSTRKLRLADPSLASLPVGGNFIAGDRLRPSAFEAALPLRSVDGGGGEILLFRRYESDPP